LETYQDVINGFKDDGLAEDATPPLDPAAELATLRNSPDAPRHAARDANRKIKQARELSVAMMQAWLDAIDAAQDDLSVLDNSDVNRIFQQLKSRTAVPNWENENESELVAESLTHVENVVKDVRLELERRMADTGRIMGEIAARSYRYAISVLDELQLLQGMSAVELRGAWLPLIKIDLRRPEEDEGKERMRLYMQKVIDDAVKCRQSSQDDGALQKLPAAAVRASKLVEQLVSLDDIRFEILKPRSSDSAYRSSDYDRWNDLVFWSVGQRYIGQFTVFVVLMAYLRQRFNPGQETSVVVADNPFGGASSGHILEILSVAVKQTGIQLICVTAHSQSDIMKEFSVLYSLVSRSTVSGQLRMIAKDESPRAMEAARGVINGEERPEWKMEINGQLRLF
jgi:hypothetical protein